MKDLVVGIDIGGTNTAFGVVNREGRILARNYVIKGDAEEFKNSIKKYEVHTQAHKTFDGFIADLVSKLKMLLADNDFSDKILAIGVGAPNANFKTGQIVSPPNLIWDKEKNDSERIFELKEILSEKMDCPVAVTNDANAAAIGERQYGIAKGKKDFIMITLGTGVGSGIVSGGRLIDGHDGNAGELGHTVSVRFNGRPCGCGGFGHLETYASAPGISRTAREFIEAKKDTPSILRDITDREITSKDVGEAAGKGDKIALEVFEFTGKILGEAFADFAAFSRPEFFVLFGGPVGSFQFFEKSLLENMNKNLMPIFKNKIEVKVSGLDSAHAAVLGASALAWGL